MLSIAMKSKIKKLLEKIEIQTPCLNTTELEGLFYALVITPELIAPSEWIPIIFDDETPECDSNDVLQQLISECILAYNYFNTLYLNGNLHFPYNLKTWTPDLTDKMMDWNFGFWQGLQLRMEFWNSGIFSEKMKLKEDPIAEILKVIEFISNPEYIDSEFFNNILQNKPVELSNEAFWALTINESLEILPDMVNMIQRFADVIKENK
jgi:yecA family protein